MLPRKLLLALLATGVVLAPSLLLGQAPAQVKPTIEEAIRQVRAGDPLGAILISNDVVAQNGGNARLVARAHAVRAMAYLAMNQPERAQAAVALAAKADPAYVPSADEVTPATINLFASHRAPVAADPEAEGASAEAAGNYQQAFLSYLRAYQALPATTPTALERQQRERIIRTVMRLPAAPIVPQAALDHGRKADQLLEAEALLGASGNSASARSAETELLQALRIAPWWPDATFKLATVQQRLQRVDEALANLNLYKLADPRGYADAVAAKSPRPAPVETAPAPPPAAAAVPRSAGTATITVMRVSNFFGSGARVRVECNNQKMAELQNGRMIRFTAPAGKVTLHFQGDDPIAVDLVAGGDYYFRGGPGPGTFNTRQITAEEGQAHLKEKNPKPNDARRTMATECRAFAP